jgi:tryptophan-rich sensory protein
MTPMLKTSDRTLVRYLIIQGCLSIAVGLIFGAGMLAGDVGGITCLAIGLFLGQLALNAAWSPVFFALHLTQLALLIITALAVLLAATIYQALLVNRAAAWLLVPYLLWILYASTLNAGIVALNP